MDMLLRNFSVWGYAIDSTVGCRVVPSVHLAFRALIESDFESNFLIPRVCPPGTDTAKHSRTACGLDAITVRKGELGGAIARNLAPAGTMLVYGALSSHRQTDPAKFVMPIFAPRLIYSTSTVRGWWLPRWVNSQPLSELRAATSDLLTMLSNGALTPPESVRYSIKAFQDAVHLADGETGQQKVLLDFSK